MPHAVFAAPGSLAQIKDCIEVQGPQISSSASCQGGLLQAINLMHVHENQSGYCA